jgi:hypothetical protein
MKMQEMESGLCVLFLFSSFSFSFYLFPSSSIMLPFFSWCGFPCPFIMFNVFVPAVWCCVGLM